MGDLSTWLTEPGKEEEARQRSLHPSVFRDFGVSSGLAFSLPPTPTQVGCLRGQWGKQVWVGGWAAEIFPEHPFKEQRSSRRSVPSRGCFRISWRSRNGDYCSQSLVCESYVKHPSQQASLKTGRYSC